MVYHLDISIATDYSIVNDVKLDGVIVNKAYFTRNIIRIQPSPKNNTLVVLLPGEVMYILTADQASDDDNIYIVDSVGGVAPSSLLDLALKINSLMKS